MAALRRRQPPSAAAIHMTRLDTHIRAHAHGHMCVHMDMHEYTEAQVQPRARTQTLHTFRLRMHTHEHPPSLWRKGGVDTCAHSFVAAVGVVLVMPPDAMARSCVVDATTARARLKWYVCTYVYIHTNVTLALKVFT